MHAALPHPRNPCNSASPLNRARPSPVGKGSLGQDRGAAQSFFPDPPPSARRRLHPDKEGLFPFSFPHTAAAPSASVRETTSPFLSTAQFPLSPFLRATGPVFALRFATSPTRPKFLLFPPRRLRTVGGWRRLAVHHHPQRLSSLDPDSGQHNRRNKSLAPRVALPREKASPGSF